MFEQLIGTVGLVTGIAIVICFIVVIVRGVRDAAADKKKYRLAAEKRAQRVRTLAAARVAKEQKKTRATRATQESE